MAIQFTAEHHCCQRLHVINYISVWNDEQLGHAMMALFNKGFFVPHAGLAMVFCSLANVESRCAPPCTACSKRHLSQTSLKNLDHCGDGTLEYVSPKLFFGYGL